MRNAVATSDKWCPTTSPHPHPLQGRVYVGFPEPHGPTDLEIRNQPGHAPAVEVALADAEVGADLFLGQEGGGLFGARRISWRVHAGAGMSTRSANCMVATNGDNQFATDVSAVPNGPKY